MVDNLKKLSLNLKRIRNNMGLSLNEVSKLTGVSKTMLGQIEREESSPTISTIWKISDGLRVSFASLIGETATKYELININELRPTIEDNGNVLLYNIFPFSPIIGFDFFQLVFKPGCKYDSTHHLNVREEFIVMTSGKIELTIGDQVFELEQGQAISFHGQELHTYANKEDVDAIAQIVVQYN